MSYRDVFERSIDDPAGFWGEQAALVDWIRQAARRCSTTAARRSTAGSPTRTLNTCYNALDRHVVAGRGDQAALIYDSPVTGTRRTLTYAELLEQVAAFAGRPAWARRREGRPGRHLHADDPRGRRRDARLRPDRRRALRGVRRLRGQRARRPHRRRPAQGRRRRARAASSRPGSSSTSRCSTGPSTSPSTGPPPCVVKQRPQAEADAGRGPRRRLGRRDARRRDRPGGAASRWRRPTRSTSSTPPARPASRRASSATTAATRSRWPGRCRTSTTCTPARSGGRPPTSAGSSATPTSSTRR